MDDLQEWQEQQRDIDGERAQYREECERQQEDGAHEQYLVDQGYYEQRMPEVVT